MVAVVRLLLKDLCATSEGRKKLIFRFFAIFAKFRPRPGDLGLGYRVPNKLATTAAKITEIRQRTTEPTHPSSHLMAAERT